MELTVIKGPAVCGDLAHGGAADDTFAFIMNPALEYLEPSMRVDLTGRDAYQTIGVRRRSS